MEILHFFRAGSAMGHLPNRLVYLDVPKRADIPKETDKAIDYKNIEKMTKAELTKLKEDVKAEIAGSKTPEDLFNALAERLAGSAETGIQRRETADGEHVKREAYVALTPEQQKEVKYYRAKEKGAKIFLHDTVDVLFLQALLHKLDCKGADGKALAVDGVWGDNTKGAVKAFQEKAHIKVDGEFGPKTFMALAQYVSKLPGGVAAPKSEPAAGPPEAKRLNPEQQKTLEFLQKSDYKNYINITPEGRLQWKYTAGTLYTMALLPNNVIEIYVPIDDVSTVSLTLDAQKNIPSAVNQKLTDLMVDEKRKRREEVRAERAEGARARSDAAFAEKVKAGARPLSEVQKTTLATLQSILANVPGNTMNTKVDDAGALFLTQGKYQYAVKLLENNRIVLTVETYVGQHKAANLHAQEVVVNLNGANEEFIEKAILDTERALKEKYGEKKKARGMADGLEDFNM